MTAFAAIHAGLRQLGIEQDDARDIYERQTGKRSLREMGPRELQAVVDELRRLGFRRSGAKASKRHLEGRFARKLQAMWIAGWNLGVVRDRTDEAMISFLRRQTGLDHVRFLYHSDDARKAIEALKGMLAREGGVEWGRDKGYTFLGTDGGKVAWAQYRILVPGATLMGNRMMFHREVLGLVKAEAGTQLEDLRPEDWQAVMNAFGDRVRRARSTQPR